MGGKGGGGGASYADSMAVLNDPAQAAYYKGRYDKEQKPKFSNEQAFYENYGIDPATMRPGSTINDPSYQFNRDVFTKLYGSYKGASDPNAARADAYARDPSLRGAGATSAPAPAARAPTDDERAAAYARDPSLRGPGAPAPAPAAPAPAAAAPPPTDKLAVPGTAQLDTGSGVDQPTGLGDDLASTIAGKNYWIGGVDSTKNTKSNAGKMTTTQT